MKTKRVITVTTMLIVAAALGAASGIALGDGNGGREASERGFLSRLLGGEWGESEEHERDEHEGWLSVASKERGESEEHEREEHERRERERGGSVQAGSSPAGGGASAALYAKECGACHLAYPARFLPAGSWKVIMGNLADHFGENAELDSEDQRAITGYLVTHAGKRSWMTRLTSAGKTPLRITELAWFERKHDEIPVRLVRDNPKVRSYSNCDACHTRAARGSFDEDEVRIPGARGWES